MTTSRILSYGALGLPLAFAALPIYVHVPRFYADIAGMYFPFTVESNINTDGPFFTIPATMGHEMAHQCGFMREDEANFIAYLACKQSDDALMRYSGYLLAYDNAVSALRKVDPEAAKAIGSGLSAAVRRDLAQRTDRPNECARPHQRLRQSLPDDLGRAVTRRRWFSHTDPAAPASDRRHARRTRAAHQSGNRTRDPAMPRSVSVGLQPL